MVNQINRIVAIFVSSYFLKSKCVFPAYCYLYDCLCRHDFLYVCMIIYLNLWLLTFLLGIVSKSHFYN